MPSDVQQMESVPIAKDSGFKNPSVLPAWSWALLGPGLLVCLADTDAGCLIVAAQSGARYGYSLLGLNLCLIPALFFAQELTVRLGVCTGQGHAACIRKRFGPFWAWVSTVLLVITCVGAIISEMSGIASVAEMWGLNRTVATLSAAILMGTVVICGTYKQVEAIGVACGLCELVFVATMFISKPSPLEMVKGLKDFPINQPEFSELVASNIGAVLMPWMIYFQQSAVVARKLTTNKDLEDERSHTLAGSILTQMIMIGTMVTMAAAHLNNKDLKDVGDIASALAPMLGVTCSKIVVSLGFIGGSLCGAFVVALAASWSICEASGWDERHSLDSRFSEAPRFYASFLVVTAIGVIVLLTGVNVVRLNIYIEMLDALLMPMAIGFLYILATGPQLPDTVRVKGVYKAVIATVFTTCTVFALGSGFYSLGHAVFVSTPVSLLRRE